MINSGVLNNQIMSKYQSRKCEISEFKLNVCHLAVLSHQKYRAIRYLEKKKDSVQHEKESHLFTRGPPRHGWEHCF